MEMDHLGTYVALRCLFDILGLLPSRGELEAPFYSDRLLWPLLLDLR